MGKFIGVFLVLLIVVCLLGITYCHYNNMEILLRNLLVAQQEANEVTFDKTWKIVQQQAEVADEYKEAFKEIYPQLMEGRYGNDKNSFMKWVQEANPNFDTSLYKQLMASIENQRTEFSREQNKLIDIKREHDNLRTTFPGNIFVGGRPEFKIIIVTSTKTDKTFKEGKEDDTKVFKK